MLFKDPEEVRLISMIDDIMPVPTYTRHEHRLRDKILEIARLNSLICKVDDIGNVYLNNFNGDYKGEGQPCVVAHMDTVHDEHIDLIHFNKQLLLEYGQRKEKDNISVIAKDPRTFERTGIGGDDKAGVVISLYMMLYSGIPMKAAFFVSEEIGCIGSSNIGDLGFFDDVSYVIQFDAPGNNWVSESCNDIDLFDDEFKERIIRTLKKQKKDESVFSRDPFTDVKEVRKSTGLNCVNIFAGYHGMHTDSEYIDIAQMKESISFATDFIKDD